MLWFSAPASAQPAEGPGFLHGPRGPLAQLLSSTDTTTRILQRMSQRLELTQAQQDQILPLLEETRKELLATQKATKALMESTKEKIDGILTAEQRTKTQEMKGRLQQLRGNAEANRRGPRGNIPQFPILRAVMDLNLTDDQRTAIRKTAQVFRGRMAEAKTPEQRAGLRQDLRTALENLLTTEQKAGLAGRLSNATTPLEPNLDQPSRGPRRGEGDRPGPRDGRGPRGPRDRNS